MNRQRNPTFLGAILHTFVFQQVASGINLLVAVVLARALGPGGRGELAVVMASISILGSLSQVIGGGNEILMGEDFDRQGALITHTIVWGMACAIVLGLGALAMPRPTAALFLGNGSWAMVLGLGIGSFLTISSDPIRRLLTARQDFYYLNKAGCASLVAYALLVLGCALIHPLTANLAFALYLVYQFGLLAVYLHRLAALGRQRLAFRWAPSLLRASTRIGLRAFLTAAATTLLSGADIWTVGYLLGNEKAGLYRVAITFSGLSWLVSSIVNRVIIAKAVTEAGGESRTLLVGKLALIGSLAGTIVIMLCRGMFVAMFSRRFAQAFVIVPELWIAFSFLSYATIINALLLARLRYPARLVWWGFAAVAVSAGLNWELCPRLGLTGAGIAALAAYAVVAFANALVFSREFGIPLCRMIWLGRDDRRTIGEAARYLRRRAGSVFGGRREEASRIAL